MTDEKHNPPKSSLPADQLRDVVLRGLFVFGMIAVLGILAKFGIISRDQFDSLLEGISGEEIPEFPTYAAPTPFPGLQQSTISPQFMIAQLQAEIRILMPTICPQIETNPGGYGASLREACATYQTDFFIDTTFLSEICPHEEFRDMITENVTTYPRINGQLLLECQES